MKHATNLSAVVASLAMAVTSHAASIVVTNGSFESPDVTGLSQTTTPTGWTWQPATGNVATAWTVDEGWANAPNAPDGDQWLMLDARNTQHGNGYLYQHLGIITAGTTYDWSAWMGRRSDGLVPPNTAFMIGLFTTSDGLPGLPTVGLNTRTQSDFNYATDMADFMHQFTSSWVAPIANDGDALYFRIGVASTGTTTHQFLFDNVTVIPEPSATMLGGLGMLALFRRRRA